MLFIKSLNRIPGSDDKLVEAFAKYKNTYTGINFDSFEHGLRTPPVIPGNNKSEIRIESKNIKPRLYPNCRIILREILEATDNVGHINSPKQDDGLTRTIPAFVNYPYFDPDNNYQKVEDNYYIFMTLKMFIDYLKTYKGENISEVYVDSKNNLVIGSKMIPLNSRGDIILNWYGNSDIDSHETFTYIPFWKVVKSIKDEKNGIPSEISKDYFKDKIVFVGSQVLNCTLLFLIILLIIIL